MTGTEALVVIAAFAAALLLLRVLRAALRIAVVVGLLALLLGIGLLVTGHGVAGFGF